MFDLYAITPEQPAGGIEQSVRRVLAIDRPERIAVLMRTKHLPSDEQRALGRTLRVLTQERGATFLISGDLALCKALGADGVQLPERGPSVLEARAALGPNAWIGASRHDAEGLTRAAAQGATFATLSPVYASPDKGTPLGEQAFAALVRSAALPVVALGGIEPAHVGSLIRAGAAAIAAIRAVLGQNDPKLAASRFLAEIDQARSLEPLNPGGHGL